MFNLCVFFLFIFSLSWSNGISLHPETLMSFIVKNHKGKPHILILSITNMTPSIIKVGLNVCKNNFFFCIFLYFIRSLYPAN
jgi:hypothetical protein